jgi:hypothetical protein
MASAMATSWSLVGLIHVPGGDLLVIVSAAGPAAGQHSACHIIYNIRSGGLPRHQLALAVAVVTHTHTYKRQSPAAPRSLEMPRSHHISPFCAWNLGLQLQSTAAPQWRLRRTSWHGDWENERPLCAANQRRCSPFSGGFGLRLRLRGSYRFCQQWTGNYVI